jgi:hypothetical protein
MANYYVNEAAFDLTDRVFVDKTVHALESKLPSGQTLAVFVHRRPIEGSKSLRELVDENVALNEMRLSAFKVLDEVQADVGGLPGILLRTRWRLGGTMYHQRQAHVAASGKLMIFAVSAPFDEQAACDETFETILQTITWRSD